MKTALFGVLIAAGCGGTAPPGGSNSEPLDSSRVNQSHAQGRKPAVEQHDAEMNLPPEVKRFHDTLAPRWHAEHTPQRMADTCAAIGQFHTDATAIVDAAPPKAGDASGWASGGRELDAAVAGLDKACQAHDAAAFDTAFEKVHRSFHRVMEAGGASEDHAPAHPEHEASSPDR
ncbi:MAG TPA: hypothetical protein VGC42_06640 [Kofleriaceae bacterium]